MLTEFFSSVRRAFALPPAEAASRLARRVMRKASPLIDCCRTTFAGARRAPSGEFFRLVRAAPDGEAGSSLLAAVEQALNHRFSLLGSGPVCVHFGLRPTGIEGVVFESSPRAQVDAGGLWLDAHTTRANRAHSRRLWALVDRGYQPIDWQIDFKSGYRWSSRRHHTNIAYGHRPGVDVKVPWELARCQHHIWLARAYMVAKRAGELSRAEQLRREFRNEVLDFISSNPPSYGVNWVMPMDVAIRAANWLLAFDLFCAAGASFDHTFLDAFRCSVFDHGHYVIKHLEWSAQLRSNHYLANVVGLLFIAAYLPRDPRTDAWLALAVQEVHREVLTQFGADGGNFEGSTSYHRLSCEMALYATAVVLGLPAEKQAALREYDPSSHRRRPPLERLSLMITEWVPDRAVPFTAEYFDRLHMSVLFANGIMRNDGRVPQIGDADSGRFFKADPAFAEVNLAGECPTDPVDGWREDFLDHRHLLHAYCGLFAASSHLRGGDSNAFEAQLIMALGGNKRRPIARLRGTPRVMRERRDAADDGQAGHDALVTELLIEDGADLRDGMQHRPFPEFGLFVIETSRVHLALRSGPIGQNGVGGHAHNDQLAIDLALDGRPVFADAGSYIYTPFPEWRNRFRSTCAHSTINLRSIEQNDWLPGRIGLFSLTRDRSAATVEEFGEGSFCGSHRGFGTLVRRRVELLRSGLRISDFGPREISARFCLAPGITVQQRPDGAISIRVPGLTSAVVLQGRNIEWLTESGWFSSAYGEKTACWHAIAVRRRPG